MIRRAVPEGSWVEIANLKKRFKTELRARGYFYDRGYIISAVSGIAETGEPTILSEDTSNSDLGMCFCDRLLEFRLQTPNIANDKQSDWPAYKASGPKSIRSFEANSWMITADTMNTALIVTARPRLSLHTHISVQGIANLRHEDIGAAIRKTLQAAMVLRDNSVI